MEIAKEIEIHAVDTVEGLESFECGVPTMDKFIHNGLQQSIAHHYCQLYTATMNQELVAIFALCFDSIDLDSDDKEDLQLGFSQAGTPEVCNDYEDIFYSKQRYPALDIAYLAVKKEYRQQRIGESIVNSIKQMARQQKMAGCQFLSVEAYNIPEYSAVPFYDKCGFAPNEYPNPNKDTLRMFYTLYSKTDNPKRTPVRQNI